MQEETINVKEAIRHFEDLVKRVESGSHIILQQDKKPIVHMWPFPSRVAGLHSGSIKTSPDFDDELPDSYWMPGK